jgi:flagellar basal body-associated protein FliL
MYCSNCGHKNDDTARFCTNCGKALQSPQPPESSTVQSPVPPATGESSEPGRGGLILAFGILSVIALGLVLGIPAWVMANRDLRKMKSGKMESRQRGVALAGMVLGIIGTFLSSGAILAILAVTTTVGTFNALKKEASAQNLASISPSSQSKQQVLAYYEDIDQIRGQTADETPAVYLLRVSLGYDPADKQIPVDLDQNQREIQNLLLKLISQKTVAELSPAHYDALQEELRDAINAIMTNSKIKSVVFREFTVVK